MIAAVTAQVPVSDWIGFATVTAAWIPLTAAAIRWTEKRSRVREQERRETVEAQVAAQVELARQALMNEIANIKVELRGMKAVVSRLEQQLARVNPVPGRRVDRRVSDLERSEYE